MAVHLIGKYNSRVGMVANEDMYVSQLLKANSWQKATLLMTFEDALNFAHSNWV